MPEETFRVLLTLMSHICYTYIQAHIPYCIKFYYMNICFCPELLYRNATEIKTRAISTALIIFGCLKGQNCFKLDSMGVDKGSNSYNKLDIP